MRLQKLDYYKVAPPEFRDLLMRYLNGEPIYLKVVPSYANLGRVSELSGSIVKVKKITSTHTGLPEIAVGHSVSVSEVKIQVGWSDRKNVATISGWYFDSLVWLEDYEGETLYCDTLPSKKENAIKTAENAKDFVGNSLTVGDPVLYSRVPKNSWDDTTAGLMAGILQEIKVRKKNGRIFSTMLIRSVLDGEISEISNFSFVAKLTDNLKDDVLLAKLRKE